MVSFNVRSVKRELEARLSPVDGAGGTGKAERKWYGNGEERLKIKASGLDVPDQTVLTLEIGGRHIATLLSEGGKLRYEVEMPSDEAVPDVEEGDVLRIEHRGAVLLEGRFVPD